MTERLLINPTLADVNAALAELCEAANKGQRARTATLTIAEQTWAADRLLLHAGGYGVPNSYRDFQPKTTVVGCCWSTLADGTRVVRVEAKRAIAARSAYGRRGALPFGFGTAITKWEKADPREVIRSGLLPKVYDEIDPARGAFGTREELTGGDRTRLGVAADWLEERGMPTRFTRLYLDTFTEHPIPIA